MTENTSFDHAERLQSSGILNPLTWVTRIGDKAGSLGALVSAMGMLGPIILLLSLYPWFQYRWSSYATYTGIGMMLAVSIWDLVSPASRRCTPDGCEFPLDRAGVWVGEARKPTDE